MYLVGEQDQEIKRKEEKGKPSYPLAVPILLFATKSGIRPAYGPAASYITVRRVQINHTEQDTS